MLLFMIIIFGGYKYMKKKILSIMLVLSILFGMLSALASCVPVGKSGEYTYRAYTSALGTNWNPHTWETSADREIMEYLTTPLVDVLPLDTGEGSYQWSFEMAERVEDITARSGELLSRYGVVLPEGVSADEVDSGFVFEITLREGLRYEDGSEIDAEDFVRSMELLLSPEMKNGRANTYISGESAIAGARAYFNGEGDFSTVGCAVTGRLSFIYVTESYIDYNYFLASLSSSWLVHEAAYLSGIDYSGALASTDYNTSRENTVSTGPYRIASHQDEKELVLVRNENWYGWQEADGRILSYTGVPIDGERREQYMTTKVVISVMDDATARQSFTRGELSVWTPTADEFATYKYSDNLYSEDETYTMSLFFNTDKDALLAMDRARGNRNSVVLTNEKLRRAFSLAIDRSEFCLATEGYTPQYALLNHLYYYDIYSDPESVYRESDAAMEAVLRVYGTEWGEGTPYPTLESAYLSITGYNLTLARELFAEACEELTAEGLYTPGEPIKIKVAWAKGALGSDDNQQVALINRHLNAAASGSGFGKITLEPTGQIANRYAAVPNGEYAIGYGAWGGAAFYPFRTLRVYLDPEYENLHEGACWSPDKESLTLSVGGKAVTKTWQEWILSLSGSGEYSRADVELKLEILASLESGFLEKYYRIPLATSTTSRLLSYQVGYYTDKYSPMYGFGGFRLLKYYYDDREFSQYVMEAGGRLRYE